MTIMDSTANGIATCNERGIKMKLTDRTYNILKWIAQYFLPAIGTLYFTLSSIWGFPYGEQIVGTITAIDVCLGVLLGISSAAYNKENKTL